MKYKVMIKGLNEFSQGFGEMTFEFAEYKEALKKYQNLKEEFKNRPVRVIMYSIAKDEIMYSKSLTKVDTFDNLFLTVQETVRAMNENKCLMNECISECDKTQNKLLHEIETEDYTDKGRDELLEVINSLKENMFDRRICKSEMQLYNSIAADLRELTAIMNKSCLSVRSNNGCRYNHVIKKRK